MTIICLTGIDELIEFDKIRHALRNYLLIKGMPIKMIQNKEKSLSESMEMYLVTIARIQKGNQPVPLSELADSLGLTTVSVNEMCRKLQSNGYLTYRPYKGALLSAEGEKIANQTLRRHRLWEVFLVEKLQMGVDDANEIACELEHVSPEDLIQRLDAYLAYPNYSPRGFPIPKSHLITELNPDISLRDLAIGKAAKIVHCTVAKTVKEFLAGQGIQTGTKVTPIAAGPDNLLVEVDGVHLALSCEMAGRIFVSPILSEYAQELDDVKDQKPINNQDLMKGKNMAEGKAVATKQIPLSDLKKDQMAVIVGVGGKGAIKRRMMDMGIVPGSDIRVVRIAPFGDPIEYLIKGYSLSLRKSEAKDIIVEIITD